MVDSLRKAAQWALGEFLEKINIFETWRELKKLGVKYGRRFFIAAVLYELFEDVCVPILLYHLGFPELIPAVLILHGEPLVYPFIFFGFKVWDHYVRGLPWHPDRPFCSNGYRTAAKVASYRVVALGAFGLVLWNLGLSLWLLTAYSLAMTFFGLVHERLWHDTNFGIVVATDQVRPKRVLAKTLSYRSVSTLVMLGVFTALLGNVPWWPIISYQMTMFFGYLMLESFWARTDWGIRTVTCEQVGCTRDERCKQQVVCARGLATG